MNISKTQKLFAIALTLVLSFGILLPFAAAHDPPWNIPTFIYITATPDPVGINQQMFLVVMCAEPPPTAAGAGGDRWQGYTIKVTRPDGTTENIGPLTSDPTGGTYALYTPTQLGTYTFALSFPGQTLSLYNPDTGVAGSNSAYIGDYYLPSSASTTATVVQDSIEKIPAYPLPTGYWTRPISQELSSWATVASNWLGVFQNKRVQDDGIAPNSAHILWTKPIEFGGIVGGSNTEVPEAGYYTGMSYEVRFANALILQGRLYFNMPLHTDANDGPYTCIDMATGETIWQRTGIAPTFGQLYDYESPNQHGVLPSGVLYQASGSTWRAYDPFTGEDLYTLTGVPGGTQTVDKDGSIVKYQLSYSSSTNTGTISKWTTAALTSSPLVLTPGNTTNAWQYRPNGKTADMSDNYDYRNIPVGDLSGSSNPAIVAVAPGDIILGRSSGVTTTSSWTGTDDPWTLWAISDKPNTRGQILWKRSYPAPANNMSQMFNYQPLDLVNRVFTMTLFETGQREGYSLDTGAKLWGPSGTPYSQGNALQYYSSRSGMNAYGRLIVSGYGGDVFGYDNANGNIDWTFSDTNHGIESNWGQIPVFASMIADGKVFVVGGEHSPNVPLYKAEKMFAIDISTGKEVWNLTAMSASGLGEGYSNTFVADGKLVFYNLYDSQIYCIGKGPSTTTVSAPQTAVTKGSSVTITGTVLDQSPGAMGKAAISDEYMTPWMEYIYQQKPMPEDAVGVPVMITVVDSSGNAQNIGTAISDSSGNFGYSWIPTAEGLYKIIASFEGSESYGPSHNTAYLTVDPAPAAPQPTSTPQPTIAPTTAPTATPTPTASPSVVPEPEATPSTDIYIIAAAAAIIIVVVAVAAVFLRKRK